MLNEAFDVGCRYIKDEFTSRMIAEAEHVCMEVYFFGDSLHYNGNVLINDQ